MVSQRARLLDPLRRRRSGAHRRAGRHARGCGVRSVALENARGDGGFGGCWRRVSDVGSVQSGAVFVRARGAAAAGSRVLCNRTVRRRVAARAENSEDAGRAGA